MNHGNMIPCGLVVSGLWCAYVIFVCEMIGGYDWFYDYGMVCAYKLGFLCLRNVLEALVCVKIAEMLARVHVVVSEDFEFVEFLFECYL